MFSDSPDQTAPKYKVEWYDSPSSNDLSNSGHRHLTQRIPLRTQYGSTLKKEAPLKDKEIKTGDFDLSTDDDDLNNDSLFAKSLMNPLTVDKTSPDLIWKKPKSVNNVLALAALPGKNITEECLNLSKSFSSKPSTSSLASLDVISSSSSMVTPTTNRKRPGVFTNLRIESPLATSTPITSNRMVKKPKLTNILTPPRITTFNDSFDDETLDEAVFNKFKVNHPKIAEKAEAASQASPKLPDILSTPKINRSRVKASTPLYKKSKSMAEERSISSMLPSLQQPSAAPPKQMLPIKKSNTPMRKAKSFANDDDEFYDDDIFTSM